MVTQLELLIKLQGVDAEIDGLRRKLDEIPRVIESRKSRLHEAESALEAEREKLATMQKEHRRAEGELDAHLEKIRKLNHQTSQVKTNKEYHALLSEIENLKKEQNGFEEKILEIMELSTEVEKEIAARKTAVAAEKTAFEEEKSKLEGEAEVLRRELAGAEETRAGIVPSIEGEHIQMYSRVRNLRGDAVARVRDELCLGCRVSVPPQKYADVIAGDSIETCAHCQRILYFQKAEAAVKDAT